MLLKTGDIMGEINHYFVILPLLSFTITISLAIIAILKRKNSRVNIWFSVTALWWALIPLIFIIHHLTDDTDLLLTAERIVEFFFVYGVPLQVVLFHRLCNIKKIRLEIVLTVISVLFSSTAFSRYCIIGVRKYSWGYIAYGGLTFNLFALYALIGIVYGIVFMYRQYRVQDNEIIRVRIKYIMSSYIMMNILTLLNMPAINGIDIYPPGNFNFIPLMAVAYSLLKFRLLDVNQFLLKTIIWVISIVSVVVPIGFISHYIIRFSHFLEFRSLSLILVSVFTLFLLYFRYVLPYISEKLQKQSHDFSSAIDEFNSKIIQVKSVNDLADMVVSLIKGKVFASSVSLLLKGFTDSSFRFYPDGTMDEYEYLEVDYYHNPGFPGLLEKDQVEVNPLYKTDRARILELFRRVDADIIIPLLFDNRFIGAINIGRKAEGKYKRIEIQFLEMMVNSVNIAFSNSLLLREVEELNLSLENKVAERTSQLQEANSKLQEMDRLKSNFFANISHEIRTPLTLILAPVESVLHGDYKDSLERSFFENLYRNAVILLKLINNLLDLSKIEAGRMGMRIIETDIIPFIRKYTGSFHSAAESGGITVTFSSPETPVCLFIDPDKLDRIIMNLFSNSLKFTDRGGFINIKITDDSSNCYITISDSGIGIPSGKIDDVFDRFSQVDSGLTRKYEGTGIGLSLVKEFVHMHGGNVSVKSRFIEEFPEEHGTEFTITLPKGMSHLDNNDNVCLIDKWDLEAGEGICSSFDGSDLAGFNNWRSAEEPASPGIPSSHYSVLIVEDNHDMRNFLAFLLKDQYNIHFAVNGEEGLRAAEELRPDIIISDVMMPVMNGYEMTARLKTESRLRRIPLILLTAKADITEKIEGLEFGADDYLTKPFSSRELLTRIKGLLKTRDYELALEKRNREIEEDLRTARLIQTRLLPQEIPVVPGYRFHPLYIPMDEVGGDFYDFNVSSRYIEIFISDVSGHGLVSAFIALIAKMALDSIKQRDSCIRVMQILNSIICKSTVNTNYMTAFFCLVEKETRIMSYSNTGHMPPLVYRRSSDTFFELKTKGKPLGLFEDFQPVEGRIQLERGDRVVFYTDGITECMGEKSELFGEVRFKEFIKENSKTDPEVYSSALLEKLMAFSGREDFGDDLCMLVFDVE